MGVYVPFIDKPESCSGCPLINKCPDLPRWVSTNKPRKNCPLVEVPEPHGDLIDMQELVKQMQKNHPQTSKIKWLEIIAECAPTVIERSE